MMLGLVLRAVVRDPVHAASKESTMRHAEKKVHDIHPHYGKIPEWNETTVDVVVTSTGFFSGIFTLNNSLLTRTLSTKKWSSHGHMCHC